MNIESREVYIGYESDPNRQAKIDELAMFGWQYTQDVRRGRSHHSVFVRDKDMPHYYEIVELDDKYFELAKKKKYVKPIVEDFGDFLCYVILFILLVLPFVLAITIRIARRKSAIEYNNKLKSQMDALSSKAQQLMNDKK